jgi:hypothetical protein
MSWFQSFGNWFEKRSLPLVLGKVMLPILSFRASNIKIQVRGTVGVIRWVIIFLFLFIYLFIYYLLLSIFLWEERGTIRAGPNETCFCLPNCPSGSIWLSESVWGVLISLMSSKAPCAEGLVPSLYHYWEDL